jgi:two-component system OmpR family response regulator
MLKPPKILIVENDPNITTALAHALRPDHTLELVSEGKTAIYKNDTDRYDLILLSLDLADINGIDVCLQLRERGIHTPIMILSGDSRALTKISLLDAGANDFLCKPFSLGELKARMRVLLRNQKMSKSMQKHFSVSDLFLDRQTRRVSRAGVDIHLRRKEFALLECLMEHAGTVVTRDILISRAWEDNQIVWTNTIDVHIKYLRDKVDRPFGLPLIRTVHGLGYKLEAVPNPLTIKH